MSATERTPTARSRHAPRRPAGPLGASAALLIAATLTGCVVGPDYREPQSALAAGRWADIPPADAADKAAVATAAAASDAGTGAAARAAADATGKATASTTGTNASARDPLPHAAVDARWWARFGDPVLDELITRALAANTDVRIARARLVAARSANAQAGAALWPTVGVYASATRSAGSGQDANAAYGLGFDASWEIDLFGGLRRASEAAQADAGASIATLAQTQVSLAAEVARDYVLLRAYQLRIAITRANLDNQRQTLQIAQWRAQAGLVGQLDVEQARSNREQTRAQLPVLLDAASQTRHALALLLNAAPDALDTLLAADGTPAIPATSAQPLLGVPADLLRRRPDIVAAERSLAAATARIGVAEAALYPSLTLSGTLGLQGAVLSALTGGGAATRLIAAGLTAPIFDAGRLRQQVVIQTAAQEQALAAYEAALAGALRDVEDARSALANGRARGDALAEAVQAARNAALLANFRYRSGLVDFQTVLDTERTVRSLEDSQASSQADTVIAMIQLYKALGGGWSAEAAATDDDAGAAPIPMPIPQ